MRKLLYSGAIFFTALNAIASSGDTTYRFSASQAIEYALEHQKNVLNAEADEGIARAQVREITGIGLPQINGSVDIKDFFELPTSLIPGEFFGGEPGSFIPVPLYSQAVYRLSRTSAMSRRISSRSASSGVSRPA